MTREHKLLRLIEWKLLICEYLSPLAVFGLRLWIATIFWKSGLTKLANWENTIALFADEYQVPLLPPELAATLGTAVELAAPVMLLFGFGSRIAATAMLVMTGVIEFTYMHHADHVVWALVLLLVILQGPGRISIDHVIRRKYLG